MKKLYYIANSRIPTERAHGIQIIKTCEALAKHTQVELVVTNRKSQIKEDPFSYYGIQRNFKIVRLGCLDTVRFGPWGFRIETLSFALRSIGFFLFRDGIFYTRDEFLAFFLKILGKDVVWEVHMGQTNILARLIVRLRVPLVVISRGLRDIYTYLGVKPENILVAPDGVDLNIFGAGMPREKARQKLNLPLGEKMVMYTGSRQSWKGVEVLEEASKLWGPAVQLMVISGKHHSEIPLYLKAADILVLPNTAREAISRLYTSPMKLFEYMASGVPIVASDLPSIKEVLDDSEAYFFSADNPRSLASVIENALAHPMEAQEKARLALVKVKNYTWDERATKIIRFIS